MRNISYKINMITQEDGWIAIDTIGGYGSEPMLALAKSIMEEIGGELYQPYAGDALYMIKGDPYRLSFQYDDMFGSVVIMNDVKDEKEVVALLERHFEKLKNKQ